MDTLNKTNLEKIISIIKAGGIIAYPTEAVYGLGCDPLNQEAVKKILTLKQRSLHKGLIIIAAEWRQIQAYIELEKVSLLEEIKTTWPGPFTWAFPKSDYVPFWIHGDHLTVAIRLTAHPIARQICQAIDSPLVSTSLNKESSPPVRTYEEACQYFEKQVDMVVNGTVGNLKEVTPIRSALTGEYSRL